MSAGLKLRRPHVAPGTHPIDTGEYVIATPSVCRLYETVKRWIENRVPGAMIVGKQRFGKTWASKYLVRALPRECGIPMLGIACATFRQASEGTFWDEMLTSVGHAITKGTTKAKRDRLTEFLAEKARATARKRIVILLDEAQKLHELHYHLLVDLYNALDRYQVAATWLLFGQEELRHQKEVFATSKQRQILGRFMTHDYTFEGLQSIEDFKACLEAYDDPEYTEFPLRSGWSFTRYFFPLAFERGERFAPLADSLWRAFAEFREEARLPKGTEVPMQYFASTVEYVLRNFGARDSGSIDISLNMWKEAIANSGYSEAAQYLGD